MVGKLRMWGTAESKGRSWILQRGWVLLQGKWGATRAFKQDSDRIRGLLPVVVQELGAVVQSGGERPQVFWV